LGWPVRAALGSRIGLWTKGVAGLLMARQRAQMVQRERHSPLGAVRQVKRTWPGRMNQQR
jgi:hypothetical protein